MRFIGNVIEKLQRHPKRVVFPEGEEPRILQAARQFHALRLGAPIVLGDQARVKEAAEGLNIPLDGIRVIDPATSEELENFSTAFSRAPPRKRPARHRGARGDAPAEFFRRDDGGDAPGGRPGFRRVAHHRQRAAAAVPDRQGRARTSPRYRAAWSWRSRTRASAKTACCSWPIAA